MAKTQRTEMARVEPDRALTGTPEIMGSGIQLATAQTAIGMAREMQKIRGQMMLAREFPRNETAAKAYVLATCRDRRFAEKATYSYPRGGQTIEDGNIRLAELMMRCWGNLYVTGGEIERGNGVSHCEVSVLDLQTNTFRSAPFSVKHWRDTKQGGYALKDERDIDELILNKTARRLRSLIFNMISADVKADAIDTIRETMTGGMTAEQIAEDVEKMVKAFLPLGVTKEMIEKRLQHALKATSPLELHQMRQIYLALTEERAEVADYFEVEQKEIPQPARMATAVDNAKAALRREQAGIAPLPAPIHESNDSKNNAPEGQIPFGE
jgi:hypothetical protein